MLKILKALMSMITSQSQLTAFRPAWWLKNKHLQTLFPVLFPRKVKIPLLREKFILPDGDFLFLDWSENKFEEKPVLVFLHGLGGSSDSHYIQGMMQTSIEKGFRSVCLHFRTCAEDSDKTPLKKGYHAGETQDLNDFLENLFANTHPAIPIFMVGYSLGGNVLLKWLGENRCHSRIGAAVAVSVPFDLAESANQLNTGFSRLYQWRLLRSLRKTVLGKIQGNGKFVKNNKMLQKLNTFWEFDDKVTAPMHGFLNVHDYYSQSSSKHYLSKIKTPTLIIQAADDPFFLKDAIPHPLTLPDCVKLEILSHGGHVGFIEGKMPFSPRFYLERRVMHYFLNELSNIAPYHG